MTKTCIQCEHHEGYIEEDEGEYYDEGCYCCHEEGNNSYHINNCMELVVKDEEYKGCPYFKESEDY